VVADIALLACFDRVRKVFEPTRKTRLCWPLWITASLIDSMVERCTLRRRRYWIKHLSPAAEAAGDKFAAIFAVILTAELVTSAKKSHFKKPVKHHTEELFVK